MAKQLARVRTLTLSGLGLVIDGTGKVEKFIDDLHYDGKLTVRKFNPRKLLTALGASPPDTRDTLVLTKATLDLALKGNTAQLTLQPVRGRFDDTQLNGQVHVKDFTEPVIRFDLTLDALNVDGYQPPATDPRERPSPKASTVDLAREKFPNLNLVGNFRIGTFKLYGQQASNAIIKVNWDP